MLFAKVVLALMLGPAGRGVPRHAARRPPGRACASSPRSSAPASLVDALLADHGLFHLEADLRWIDLTVGPARRAGREVGRDRPPDRRAEPLLEARDVALSFGETPALRGASVVDRRRRDRSPSWARAARASRRCCTAWPASSCPTPARSTSTARASTRCGEAERSALRRDRFGFVFQFGQLVPELTAEENVALPLLLGGVAPGRGAAPRPGPGSTGSDLDGLERRRSGELSGGQAQRVALARGLVGRARRCCSPTSPPGRSTRSPASRSWSCWSRAAREQGTTVVLVTHEARVAAYADREVIVRDGRVAARRRAGAGVIRLGLRLAVAGGREAVARLAVIAAAVALGVGLLLTTLAGINAVDAQNDRYAWLETGYAGADAAAGSRGRRPAVVAAARRLLPRRADRPGRRRRHRPGLAGAARHPARCPARASSTPRPALADLLAHDAGRRARPTASPAGRSARSAPRRCPSPDSLLVIVGRDAAELAGAARRRARSPRSAPPTRPTAPACCARRRHQRRRHHAAPRRSSPPRCCSRC